MESMAGDLTVKFVTANSTSITLYGGSTNDTIPHYDCDTKFHHAETPALFLAGIIVNILSVAMLARISRKGRSRIACLTILLASNDLFSCTMFLSSSVINTATCDHFKDHFMCDVLGLFAFASFMWSLNIIVLLSVERYMLIKYPFFHRKRWSLVILVVICVTGLVFDFTLGILPLTGVGLPYLFYDENRFCCMNLIIKDPILGGGVAQKVLVVSLALNGILRAVAVAYFNLAVSLYMRKRSTEVLGAWNPTQAKAMENASKYANLTQVIAIADVLLTVPFCIRLLIDTAMEKDNVDNIEDTITSFLVFGSPLVNPFLYVASNKACRECLWDTLRCRKFRRDKNSSTSRRSSSSLAAMSRRVSDFPRVQNNRTTLSSSDSVLAKRLKDTPRISEFKLSNSVKSTSHLCESIPNGRTLHPSHSMPVENGRDIISTAPLIHSDHSSNKASLSPSPHSNDATGTNAEL